MKLFVNLVLVLIIFSLNSCCDRTGYPIAEIDVAYSSYNGFHIVWDIRTEKGGFENVIDTVKIYGEPTYLYTNNGVRDSYMIRLLLDNETYNHILIPSDSSRIDTISQITIHRDKCEDVESIGYYWNGTYSEETYRETN